MSENDTWFILIQNAAKSIYTKNLYMNKNVFLNNAESLRTTIMIIATLVFFKLLFTFISFFFSIT
jgi:hypothetical protein